MATTVNFCDSTDYSWTSLYADENIKDCWLDTSPPSLYRPKGMKGSVSNPDPDLPQWRDHFADNWPAAWIAANQGTGAFTGAKTWGGFLAKVKAAGGKVL